MKVRVYALFAAFAVQLLYATSYTFAKDVLAGGFVDPFAFVLIRALGATVLFWLFNWIGIGPKEKIDKKDYLSFLIAAVFGVIINMLFFINGLKFTSPIHASVIVTLVPIIVLLLSSIYLKERITGLKITGVISAFIGALVLTLYGKSILPADNIPLGNALVFGNVLSLSIYFILIKKLTIKYHPFTFLKWLFLFGSILMIPFGYSELVNTNFLAFSPYISFSVIFVVVGATFCTYLLNPLAMSHLKASTVSMFIYLQPLIAGVFAMIMGTDTLSEVKIIASLLIFTGVYLVSKKAKGEVNDLG